MLSKCSSFNKKNKIKIIFILYLQYIAQENALHLKLHEIRTIQLLHPILHILQIRSVYK